MRALILVMPLAFVVACRSTTTPPPPAGTPVRLELAPASVLVSPGQPHALTLKAFDADGVEVDPGPVTWASSRPELVAVDGSGVVSGIAVGSAQVTATVGELKASTLALTAQLVPGAMQVTDAQLARRFVPVDATTPYGPGFRYRVDLVGVTPPAPGTILVASEAAPLAGRVVEVSGQTVTLEVVPVSQVFAAIELHETFTNLPREVPQRTLSHVTTTTNGNGTTTYSVKKQPLEFELGPFDCEVEAGVAPAFEFQQADFTVTDEPVYEVEFTSARQRLIMTDEPVVSVTLKPTFKADLAGKLECKLELYKREFPVPGPVGIFFGASVLAGVGFGLEAKVPLVDGVSVLMTSQVKGRVRAGVDCTNFVCAPVKEVEVQKPMGTFAPQVDLALPTALPKLELTADVFSYLDVKAGVTILRRFSFDTPRDVDLDLVDTKLGLRATASLATEARQVQERGYASSYGLSLHGEVSAGEHIDKVLELLGAALGVSFEVKDLDVPLAQSPKAAVTLNQRSFGAGDTVRAEAKFDPATVTFPLVGDNLEKVRLYRVVRPSDGGTDVGLVLMAEELAIPGVRDYTLSGVATQASVAEDFVVFATSRLWTSLSLEQEEARCTVPPGFSYCIVEAGVDLVPLRQLSDGSVWGQTPNDAALWRPGQPLTLFPPRALPNAPNPVAPSDHNDRHETLYFESFGNFQNTYVVSQTTRTVTDFRGVSLNNRGDMLGYRYVQESSPGAEDGYDLAAVWLGGSPVDLSGGSREVQSDVLSETGMAVLTDTNGHFTVPGGRLPEPDGGSGTIRAISPTGEFIGGEALDGVHGVLWRNRVPSLVPLVPISINRAGQALNGDLVLELDGGVTNLRTASFPPQGTISCVSLSDDGTATCSSTPLDGGARTLSFLVPAR